ncbi:MAG TPA: YCF48-related protein [Pyrinomonadaceae bacterium]|jgi:photosystem II stability/assembly factor-like uncharacterized protein
MKAYRICQILLLMLLGCAAAPAQWSKRESGTLAWLHTIHFVDPDNGFAGGSNGTLLATKDGGKTWRQNAKPTEDNIKEIFFSDSRNGWILCERNVYASGAASPSYLLETSDAGRTWRNAEFPQLAERITHLFSAPGGARYAVGESGVLYTRANEPDGWVKRSLTVRFLMLDGEFFDDRRGLVVGGGGAVLYTENGGLNWENGVLSDNGKTKLNAIFFSDENNGWIAGQEGKIYRTKNGGKFWQLQNSSVAANLKDIFFASRHEGVAVGEKGTILRTGDGGETWRREPAVVTHQLDRVYLAGKKWIAVGFGGTILTKAVGETGDGDVKARSQK